jgi:N-acyl-D-aspartate/D-glutamate deacylase
MTGLSAKNFRLAKRGVIKVGNYADLVLFNEEKVCDNANFIESSLPASGIEKVWVNGQLTLKNKKILPARAGVFLTPKST